MRRLIAILLFSLPLFAQTQVYLRASGPPLAYITSPGCTNTIPPTCTTATAHNLHQGDTIFIDGIATTDSHGVCGVTDSAAPFNYSNINGLRTVKSVIDATHFTLADINGVDITPNGAWCDGSIPANSYHDYVTPSAAILGKVQPFNLIAHPRVWFDGPTGTVLRQFALGTQNGLTSIVVDSAHNRDRDLLLHLRRQPRPEHHRLGHDQLKAQQRQQFHHGL